MFDILKPKARKNYLCIYCGELILKGETHSKASGKWEGEFQSWRMHNECLEQHDEENMRDGGDGVIYEYEGTRPEKS